MALHLKLLQGLRAQGMHLDRTQRGCVRQQKVKRGTALCLLKQSLWGGDVKREGEKKQNW